MSQLNKPLFKRVSPVVYYCSWGFALLNIFGIAPALFLGGSKGLALVKYLPPYFWGGVFVLTGGVMIFSLMTNNWRMIKYMTFVGCLAKSLFAWALILLVFQDFGAIGIAGIWAFLIYIQIVCIIYFTPEVDNVTYN